MFPLHEETPSGLDLHTLMQLFIAINALRDHLEAVFQHSERLSKEVTELLEQALQGRRSLLGPVLALSTQQAQLQDRAERLLQRGVESAQRLALQYGTHSDPDPRAVARHQVDGLVGLVDGLAMLEPFVETQGDTVRQQAQALQELVEQVLRAALRGEDLAVLLGFVEAERLRFLQHGEAAQAGCAGLGESVQDLRRPSRA